MTMLMMSMMLITILSWSILAIDNPMSMSIIIMLIAMLTMTSITISISSWYAMVLFLIYIGGMMVMFSYFISMSSNESMMFKTKIHFIILPYILMKGFFMNYPMMSYSGTGILNFYMKSNFIMMLLASLILLMMMMIIIKLIMNNKAPLRGFNMNY